MSEAVVCKHTRTRLIARDQDAEYVECVNCGALLEAQELAQPRTSETARFDESLSDA